MVMKRASTNEVALAKLGSQGGAGELDRVDRSPEANLAAIRRVEDFLSTLRLSDALKDAEWDLSTEIGKLVDMAKTGGKNALGAIEAIRARIVTALRLDGLLVTVDLKREASRDGQKVSATAQVERIVGNVRGSMALLEQAEQLGSQAVIDVRETQKTEKEATDATVDEGNPVGEADRGDRGGGAPDEHHGRAEDDVFSLVRGSPPPNVGPPPPGQHGRELQRTDPGQAGGDSPASGGPQGDVDGVEQPSLRQHPPVDSGDESLLDHPPGPQEDQEDQEASEAEEGGTD